MTKKLIFTTFVSLILVLIIDLCFGASARTATVDKKSFKIGKRTGVIDEQYRWSKNDEGKVIVPYMLEEEEIWGKLMISVWSEIEITLRN